MTFKEIFNELEGLGTEQNRKIYMRHGSGQNTYGVSFRNLRKMAKAIGKDHELALALWESDNVDAQSLATMIMDPLKLDIKKTELWLKNLKYSLLIGLLAEVVSKTDFAYAALKKWTSRKSAPIKAAGYSLLTRMLKNGKKFESDMLDSYLLKIRNEIHKSPNQARQAMNNALIAIGLFQPKLKQKAIATAKEIRKVEIDYGKASCKTPNAVVSIKKHYSRLKKSSQ